MISFVDTLHATSLPFLAFQKSDRFFLGGEAAGELFFADEAEAFPDFGAGGEAHRFHDIVSVEEGRGEAGSFQAERFDLLDPFLQLSVVEDLRRPGGGYGRHAVAEDQAEQFVSGPVGA